MANARFSSTTNRTPRGTNLYVKNFGTDLTETELCQLFGVHGTITSCKIQTDELQKSKGFGYVNFERPEMAQMAIDKLNGQQLDNGKQLYVGPFLKKKDRLGEIRRLREENQQQRMNRCSVYISNLDTSVEEQQLHDIFSRFGTITKTHILRTGPQSKGIAFVSFQDSEEADAAISEMNGKWILSKPIYAKLSGGVDASAAPPPPLHAPIVPQYSTMVPMKFYNFPAIMYMPQVLMPSPLPTSHYPQLMSPSIEPQPRPSVSPSPVNAPRKRILYPYSSTKSAFIAMTA